MKSKQLLSLIRQAVDKYEMIQTGDKIAVGISGGKDSLALLYALSKLRLFYPKTFTLEAITVNTGIKGMAYDGIQDYCDELQVPYTIIDTQIYDIVFTERKEENPCSLCAKLRKGTLNEKALALGCNKIAYAHHKDDLVETFLMSLLYEGRLHTFSPLTRLDKTGLTVIRPLLYVTEKNIIGFRNRYSLPVVENSCPADGYTKREEMKMLLQRLNQEHPGARERIFTAIMKGGLDQWPVRTVS